MDLSIQQIFDIKFVLSGQKKSEIAVALNMANSNQFSTIERYRGLQETLNNYFDKLNPEINESVKKITDNYNNEIKEPESVYLKIEKSGDNSRLINHLLDEIDKKDKRIEELEANKQYKQAR